MTGVADEAATSVDFETSRDAFLGGAVEVRQPRRGYRAGLDAVLLAASVSLPPGTAHRLLDIGAGVGVVGLCAAVRLPELDVTLVEQRPDLCALAAGNIADNGLADRARVVAHDVVGATAPADPALCDNGFDVVVSNPPFHDASNHRQSPNALKAAAHAMPDAGLDAWLRFMARMTRSGGTAMMIHRTDRLPAMLAAFGPRFGALTVLPLHPRAGAPSSRVIVRGIKASRAPLTLKPGVVLHGADNRFTATIDRVLKTPCPFDWDAAAQ